MRVSGGRVMMNDESRIFLCPWIFCLRTRNSNDARTIDRELRKLVEFSYMYRRRKMTKGCPKIRKMPEMCLRESNFSKMCRSLALIGKSLHSIISISKLL